MEFIPTYLYIKQHSITGKLYFGRTQRNPIKYLGSGTYWKDHIKKHGKDYVVTLWHELFIDREYITQFATTFSREMNIVDSSSWANLREENGLDGQPLGNILTEETKHKISKAKTGKPRSLSSVEKQSASISGTKNPMYGKKHTTESIQKMSKSRKGRTNWSKGVSKPTWVCPYCNTTGGGESNRVRWHFDNCKFK